MPWVLHARMVRDETTARRARASARLRIHTPARTANPTETKRSLSHRPHESGRSRTGRFLIGRQRLEGPSLSRCELWVSTCDAEGEKRPKGLYPFGCFAFCASHASSSKKPLIACSVVSNTHSRMSRRPHYQAPLCRSSSCDSLPDAPGVRGTKGPSDVASLLSLRQKRAAPPLALRPADRTTRQDEVSPPQASRVLRDSGFPSTHPRGVCDGPVAHGERPPTNAEGCRFDSGRGLL